MTKASSLLLTVFLIFLGIPFSRAQEQRIQIYPRVQHLVQTGDAFAFHGFRLQKADHWESLVRRTPVEKMLSSTHGKGLSLQIEIKENIAPGNAPKNREGAYILLVGAEQAAITAKDSTGIFYGLQTLRQLVKDGKIYPARIRDFPTVRYRGVVEGFYGTPWSQKDRLRQIKFYGRVKANTYIYGPKDDPYHSSPNWRKPYPPKQAANIKKLIKVANAHFVHFVWAIHPGQDIQWNNEDRQNVLNKFEAMYKLGVRSFAVFFDDISGVGTDAHKQAALLNFLNDHFVKVKKDVKPLILTPTDYNKSWANPSLKDGYLAILGRTLDSSVQIMWTGDQVMSDVTKSTLEWVKERIQRPALFWWNFPVSDYRRNELFIGPSYGLKKNVGANEMSGILSNPMEHAEASKPAIFGVADYGWNTASYNAEKSWEAVLKRMLPHSYKAYKLFGENNSNPSHGLSSYIGKESEKISPYIKRLEKGIKEQNVNRKDMTFIEGYFYDIKNAGKKVIKANDDSTLIQEVKPWLHNFTELGQEGLMQLDNYKFHDLDAKTFWRHIISNLRQSDYWTPESFKAGDGTKTTPVTGTTVLRPFVQFLLKWNSQKLFDKINGKMTADERKAAIGTIHSDIASLRKNKFLVVNNRTLSFQPDHQSVTMEEKESFTIELANSLSKAEVKIQYKSKEKINLEIQFSNDGKDWARSTEKKEKGQMVAQADQTFRFIRITNTSSKKVAFQLNKLTIRKQDNRVGDRPFTTHDFNLLTTYSLKQGDTLTEESTIINHPEKAIILTNSDQAQLRIQVNEKGRWQSLSPVFQGEYIQVKLPEGTSSIRISSDQTVSVYDVLWK